MRKQVFTNGISRTVSCVYDICIERDLEPISVDTGAIPIVMLIPDNPQGVEPAASCELRATTTG